MIFSAYTELSIRSTRIFTALFHNGQFANRVLLAKKTTWCDFHVDLVAPDKITNHPSGDETHCSIIQTLHDAWRDIIHASPEAELAVAGWQTIRAMATPVFLDDRYAVPLQRPPSVRDLDCRLFRYNHWSNRFFILVDGSERFGIPAHFIDLLLNIWNLEHERLAVHASAVVHREKLFLFAGVSGAGKSTVAAMSRERGDRVVDDDVALIYRTREGCYSVNGWGYGLDTCRDPLQAIFKLVQSAQDRLQRLTQIQGAQIIMTGYDQVHGDVSASVLLKRAFKLAAAVAREIPVYELHFRKSPDFWQLIDAPFHD